MLRTSACSVFALFLATLPAPAMARHLTFEDRVRAEEAVDRVRYARQIGAGMPFEAAVPRETLESDVRQTLAYSQALERMWHTPLLASALQREVERQERDSLDPELLEAMHAALGHDPVLLRECLARPLLAEGLIRGFYAYDGRLHASEHRRARILREDLREGRVNPAIPNALRSEEEFPVSSLEPGTARDAHRSFPPLGMPSPVLETPDAFVIRVVIAKHRDTATLATYAVRKRSFEDWWAVEGAAFTPAGSEDMGGEELRVDRLGRSPRISRTPASIPKALAPRCERWVRRFQPRGAYENKAVWTGREMILNVSSSFARYDPLTDSWESIPSPAPLVARELVWTGREVLAFGADPGQASRFDVAQDRWRTATASGAPAVGSFFTAVWTGKEALVWGRNGVGARYSPSNDKWVPLPVQGAPPPLLDHVAVWTGNRMLIWGSRAGGPSDTYDAVGYMFDPKRNTWSPMSLVGQPQGRINAKAVWTGHDMIVYAGQRFDNLLPEIGTGGRFDPVTNAWRPIAPGPRAAFQSAVWSGREMVVFGGEVDTAVSNDTAHFAARYDPAQDRWRPASLVGSPGERGHHAAVWTGDRMLVWGGEYVEDNLFFGDLSNGGRYDPRSDTWTSLGSRFAPTPRREHTAVWTGSEMLVWGGIGQEIAALDPVGGRYQPATDTWRPLPSQGGPAPRWGHAAVWDGQQWLIWGGEGAYPAGPLGDGAGFDPNRNVWTAIPTAGAPTPRAHGHRAVWTGHEMIVWGVDSSDPQAPDGAAFDPNAAAWRPISTEGQPVTGGYPAVWTGSEMLVWSGSELGGGAAYRPDEDSWSPLPPGGPFGSDQGTALSISSGKALFWNRGTDPLYLYDGTLGAWSARSRSVGIGPLGSSDVWDGSQLLVWGGNDHIDSSDVGYRYDLLNDTWSPITFTNAPSRRDGHTAVWTGRVMLLWGGAFFDEVNYWPLYSDLSAYFPGTSGAACESGNQE